jgi:hypothetical protein
VRARAWKRLVCWRVSWGGGRAWGRVGECGSRRVARGCDQEIARSGRREDDGAGRTDTHPETQAAGERLELLFPAAEVVLATARAAQQDESSETGNNTE